MLDQAKSVLNWIATSLGASRRRLNPQSAPTATGLIDLDGAGTKETAKDLTYLRLVSGGWRDLINKHWSVDDFSSKYFDLTEVDQSVFRAQNPIEEAEAIAAHFLTLHGNSNIEDGAAIRVFPEDLIDLQIRVSSDGERGGSTGVGLVDARHHDLSGSQDSLKKLTERILHDHYRGGDRIRILVEHQMACQLIRARKGGHTLSAKTIAFYDKVMVAYRSKNPTWYQSAT